MLNNQYSVYNNVTKSYEYLPGYHFSDFITAAAANLILCYRTEDTLELNPKLTKSTLDIEKWTLKLNADSSTLAEDFNKHMSHISEPFKIGPYQLDYSAIGQLIELTSELNDEQLNAHLQVTTTLSSRILLFDSIVFGKYFQRGFQAISEILEKQWFKHNVILVPVHHLNHWLIFLIDITKKTIIFFNSLSAMSNSDQNYLRAIVQLLRTHYFFTNKSTIDFTDWTIITDFTDWQQDDATSCGIHCGLFARAYITATKYPPITKMNIKTNRIQFALHLLGQK